METITAKPQASVDYPVADAVRNRWSPRAFSEKLPSKEEIGSLFEAARWSSSAFNEQPWAFLYATADNAEAHAKIASTLVPSNRAWAEKAPLLVLIVAKTLMERNGSFNKFAWYDTGQAVSNMAAQATSMGLYMHQMAGFDAALAKGLFELPESHEPIAIAAIGFLGNAEQLPEPLKTRELAPRTRKEQTSFVQKLA